MTIEQMIARQQELLNAARSAGRNMTREEAAEFDSCREASTQLRAAGAGIAHGDRGSTPAASKTTRRKARDSRHLLQAKVETADRIHRTHREPSRQKTKRIRSIEDLCHRVRSDARSYIDNGSTEEPVRAAVLERETSTPSVTGIR